MQKCHTNADPTLSDVTNAKRFASYGVVFQTDGESRPRRSSFNHVKAFCMELLRFVLLSGTVCISSLLFQFVIANWTLPPKISCAETADKMLSLLLSAPFFKNSPAAPSLRQDAQFATESDHLLYCCFTPLPSSSKYRTIGHQKACFSKSFVPSSLYALHSSVLCTIKYFCKALCVVFVYSWCARGATVYVWKLKAQ